MTEYLSSRGRQLAAEAAEAAEVRDMLTHPDVVALRVDKIRSLADRLTWAGIVISLLFTLINVQAFAAQHATTYSLSWWGAWFLDPAVSIILLSVLIADSVIAQWQVDPGWQLRAAKWSLLITTYVMNTWNAWASGSWSAVAAHSAPPLVVFAAAECRTAVQDLLTECVRRAHAFASDRAEEKATRLHAEQAREQARRDETTREQVDRSQREELDRLAHDLEVATARAAIAAAEAPPVAPKVEPAAEVVVATGRAQGRKPRSSAAKSRSRRPALDVAVLADHARLIIADSPDIGRRELATQLSEKLQVEVPPYWAQKAKAALAEDRPSLTVAR